MNAHPSLERGSRGGCKTELLGSAKAPAPALAEIAEELVLS